MHGNAGASAWHRREGRGEDGGRRGEGRGGPNVPVWTISGSGDSFKLHSLNRPPDPEMVRTDTFGPHS